MVPGLDPPFRSFAVALAMGAALVALQPSAGLAQFFGSGGYGRQPSLPPPSYPGALDEGPPRPPGLIPSPRPYPGAPGTATREIGAPVPVQPGAGLRRRQQVKRAAPGIGKAKLAAPAPVQGAPPEQPATPRGDVAVAKPANAVQVPSSAAGTVAPPAPVSASPLPPIPTPAAPQAAPQLRPQVPADVAAAKPASALPAAEPLPALVPAPAAADVSQPKPGSTVSAVAAPPAAPDGPGKDARANADAVDPNHPVPVVRQVYPPPDTPQ